MRAEGSGAAPAGQTVFLAALLLVLAWAVWRRGLRPLFSTPVQLLWLWLLGACFGPLAFDLLRGTFASLIGRYALAGLPAAILLLGFALGRLHPRQQLGFLGLIIVAWLPGIRAVFQHPRAWEPYVQIGHILSAEAHPGDLVIVHSIPSGVVGVARYMTASVPLAAWVGQLNRRRIPQDLDALLPGHDRVVLVRVHEVGEPAPEDDWLRRHARFLGQRKVRSTDLLYFAPEEGTTFEATAAASTRR